jgi:hypothetical protein
MKLLKSGFNNYGHLIKYVLLKSILAERWMEGLHFLLGQGFFVFAITYKWLRSQSAPYPMGAFGCSSIGKQLKCEADHSPSFNAENDMWNCTFSYPHVFVL